MEAGDDYTRSNVCYEPVMEEDDSSPLSLSSRSRTRPLSRSKIPFYHPPEIKMKIPCGNPSTCSSPADSAAQFSATAKTTGNAVVADMMPTKVVVSDHGDWDGDTSESSCSTECAHISKLKTPFTTKLAEGQLENL